MKKLIKVKPLFNAIVTTMDVYETDQTTGGIIDTKRTKGSMKEYQTVIAVGSMVRDIKVGDIVAINPTRYAVVEHRDDHSNSLRGVIKDKVVLGYKFNTINLDGKECLMLQDSDINFIVEEFEDVEEPTGPTIIQPEKPKIIV